MARQTKVSVYIKSALPASYRPLLARAAKAAVEKLPAKTWAGRKSVSLSVSIVGRSAIRKLNLSFRGKDKPTDVLSFPSAPVPGSDFAGDVIVCWAVGRTQTEEFGTTPREEIQRLVVHGVLHVFGFDHERSARDERVMFGLQEKILRSLKK